MRRTNLKLFSPTLWVKDLGLATELIGQFPESIVGILYSGTKFDEWLFRDSLDVQMYVQAYKTRALENDE